MMASRTMRIPFASEKHANIAKQAIEVDRELQPDVVKRTLAVEGNELVAYEQSVHHASAKLTRLALETSQH